MKHAKKMMKPKKIKARLRRMNVTQTDLASYMGISQGLVSKVINGRCKDPEYMDDLLSVIEGKTDIEKYSDGYIIAERGSVSIRVLKAIKLCKSMRLYQIAKKVNISNNHTYMCLMKLVSDGLVVRVSRGVYNFVDD